MQRSVMQEAISAPQVGGIVRLTRFIILSTFIVELAGSLPHVEVPQTIDDFDFSFDQFGAEPPQPVPKAVSEILQGPKRAICQKPFPLDTRPFPELVKGMRRHIAI